MYSAEGIFVDRNIGSSFVGQKVVNFLELSKIEYGGDFTIARRFSMDHILPIFMLLIILVLYKALNGLVKRYVYLFCLWFTQSPNEYSQCTT